MISNQKNWDKYVKDNQDWYGKTCIDVARKAMEILDKTEDFDAKDIIHQANNELNGGISSYMAGAVAQIIVQCHTKGKEFQKKWNISYGIEEKEAGENGLVNPAILTIKED